MSRLPHAMLALFVLGVWTPPVDGQELDLVQHAHLYHSQGSAGAGLDQPAGVSLEEVELSRALLELGDQTGLTVAFSPSLIPLGHMVTCDCEQVPVGQAMSRILAGTGLTYSVQGGHLLVEATGATSSAETAGDRPLLSPADLRAPLAGGALRVRTSRSGAVQTGTITGVTVVSGTAQPLGSVQVTLPDLDRGVLSGSNGQFTMEDVPAGTHTIQAERIGYSSTTQEVTVEADQVVEVQLELDEEALALDAMVITGTAGGTRERAVGNVVGRISASDITEIAPVQSVQDLMTGREPGVNFTRASGNIGTGSQLRVRGFSSLGVGNQPLIYVDGIRVDNSPDAGPNLRDGPQTSRLDDLNPDEIESIEVIKGPAAATLYGTEASAGVVQIVTKRGEEGSPQFDLTVRQGATWMPNSAEKVGEVWGRTDDGELVSINIWETEKAAGRQFWGTGHLQSYNLSMRGGTELIRYYASADWDDQEGIVDYNWRKNLALRGNLSVVPHDDFSVDLSTGFVDGTTSYWQQRTSWGLWEQTQWSNPIGYLENRTLRGFLRARPEAIREMEATREVNRFTGSATLNHARGNLTQRLVVGMDVSNEENRNLVPRHPDGASHDFGGLSLGDLELERPHVRYTTVDYGASYEQSLGNDIIVTGSGGFQYYHRRHEEVQSHGQVFPAPAIRNMAGAAVTTSSEFQIENKSAGGYLQAELNYGDRIFVTGAVRGDDNSAFGADFDAAIYPKFHATWVVTDEDFWRWDHIINSLRFRSAWGKAGQQPDVFAAVRLYQPDVGPLSASVVRPQTMGDPDLGPEVSTEWEAGFDAAFLEDRLSAQVTYYHQRISDALVELPVAPSSGFPGVQQRNVGQVSNWGWEIAVDGRPYESPNYAWDVGLNISFNENRIDDMGGRAPTGMLREGFPFPSIFTEKVVEAELDPQTGRIATAMCDGGRGPNNWDSGGPLVPCDEAGEVFIGRVSPPWQMNTNTTLTLFQNLRLYAQVDMDFGRVQHSTDVSCRHTCFTNSLASNVREDPIFVAYLDGHVSGTMMGVFDAGFVKLREVTASYTLPESLAARIGASRASINASARNLWDIWIEQPEVFGAPVPDPEAGRNVDMTTSTNSNPPPLSSFMVTMRVSF